MAEKRIGIFTPQQRNEVLAVIKDYLTRTGLSARNLGLQSYNQPVPIYIENADTVDIPPFACMQVTGTAEYGGQNYIRVARPTDVTGVGGLYLFNGFNEVEDKGVAQDTLTPRVFTDGSAVVCGARWQPVIGQWYVSPGAGGLLSAIGPDDIVDDVMRAFVVYQKPDIDLRIEGLNYQINYNQGDGWETWASGEECE